MSKTVTCPRCGRLMDVPAYPGDGVYTRHECDDDEKVGRHRWRDSLDDRPERRDLRDE